MKTQHTPTPWVKDDFYDEPDHFSHSEFYDANGNLIGKTYSDETAAFIVKAVNCHDELVAALITAETYFSEYAAETPASTHTLIHIRRALAKAKGDA